MTHQLTVVAVANENAEPRVMYEVTYDDGNRTYDEALTKAIERADQQGTSWKTLAIGITNTEVDKMSSRAISALLSPIWINGSKLREYN